MRHTACLLIFLVTTALYGQNIEAPKESDAYKLISAALTAPLNPKYEIADGGWEVVGQTVAQVPDVAQISPSKIVFTGPPGLYTVIFDGSLVEQFTFKDGDGQMITLPVYRGRLKGRTNVTIRAGGPVPPNPPLPAGKYRIAMFVSTDTMYNLPPGQRDVLNSMLFRDYLSANGHVLEEIADPIDLVGVAKWQPWLAAINGKVLPQMVFAIKDEWTNVISKPLPNSIEEAKALLANPALRKECTYAPRVQHR